MEIKINSTIVSAIKGDITQETTDAIVNAANSRLAGGGGVDGAIHRAGGPAIMEECRQYNGCPTGEAVITTGGKLKAKYVIHTVGPVYKDGRHKEPELLRSAYQSCLEIAVDKGIISISFPSISTGVYGYPKVDACRIAVDTVVNFPDLDKLEEVRFVCFSGEDLKIYKNHLNTIN